jgi:carboxymethylenebutenolidase
VPLCEHHALSLPDGDVPAYSAFPDPAAFPEGAQRAVVVVHEIFGPQPEIEDVVQRFASAGYAAVSPNFFHKPGYVACVRQMLHACNTGEGPPVAIAEAARSYLAERTGLPLEKIGLIGFCIGGGFVLGMGKGWGAVSTNYGAVPPKERLDGFGPVIGCYGGRDLVFGKMGQRLKKELEAAGTPLEVHEYPTVGHSFLTNGHHPVAKALSYPFYRIRYDPEVAEDAWSKIFAFFERNLQ